ncbi:MAG: radical SAM protein [Candidatus Omnitrophica bacterium]|nr:radical SAM protein [Candidatus Omnitrophota bacterium]
MMEKFFRAIKRNINYEKKQLVSAHLELTYRCNLSCKFCSITERLKDKSQQELSAKEWNEVVNDLGELGVENITIVGAEPLIRNDIFELIENIKKRKMKCLLISNGVLIDKEKAQLLVKHQVDKISVSIDGPERIHDNIRGINGAFEKAMEGIKNILKAREYYKSRLPRVEVHITVCSLNVRYLVELLKQLKKIKLDSLSVQYLTQVDADTAESTIVEGKKAASTQFVLTGQSLLLNEAEVQILHKQIRVIKKEKSTGLSFKILGCLPDAYLKYGYFPVEKCYVVNTDMQIDPYGNIFPCSLLANYKLGNIKQLSVKELWDSAGYNDFRALIKKKLLPICRFCCHFNANLTFKQAMLVYLDKKLYSANIRTEKNT